MQKVGDKYEKKKQNQQQKREHEARSSCKSINLIFFFSFNSTNICWKLTKYQILC